MNRTTVLTIAIASLLLPSCSKKRPSDIDVCVAAIQADADESCEGYRVKTAGGESPSSHKLRQLSTCAPLLSEEGCREAMRTYLDIPVTERVPTLLGKCADAYCPRLTSPKPGRCQGPPASIHASSEMWNELFEAALRSDLGADAARVIDARKAAADRVRVAMQAYFDAGSPTYSRGPVRERMLPSDGGP